MIRYHTHTHKPYRTQYDGLVSAVTLKANEAAHNMLVLPPVSCDEATLEENTREIVIHTLLIYCCVFML